MQHVGTSTIDTAEVAKFEAMAAEWWNPDGKFKPLHMLNPCRLDDITHQIAAEFVNQQPGEAAAATFEHIRLFWDPRMLSMILAHVAAGESGLSPVAAAAIAMLGSDAG